MLVVAIHVDWPKNVICPTWFINEFVVQGIARIAVPFFFVVSGFFLAAHFDEHGWWVRETKKRIRSLVIPFFVWSLLSFVLLAPLSIVADLIAHRPFGTNLPFLEGRWLQLLGLDLGKLSNYCGQLWYVRCLFFFVLLSPIFKVGIRKFRFVWILLAFIATTVFSELPDDPENRPFWSGFLRYGISLSGIFYFSVGIYLRRFNVTVRSTPLAVASAIYGVGCLLLRTYAKSRGMELPVGMDCLVLPALMYAVWFALPSWTFPRWLTSSSFPIFLLHVIFLHVMGIVIKHCTVGLQMGKIVSCLAAIIASIVMTNLLRKRFPCLADILFANRA